MTPDRATLEAVAYALATACDAILEQLMVPAELTIPNAAACTGAAHAIASEQGEGG